MIEVLDGLLVVVMMMVMNFIIAMTNPSYDITPITSIPMRYKTHNMHKK